MSIWLLASNASAAYEYGAFICTNAGTPAPDIVYKSVDRSDALGMYAHDLSMLAIKTGAVEDYVFDFDCSYLGHY